MSNGKGGFIGQDGLNAPDPATGVSASGGDTQATVSFTAPTDVGGAAITGYSVQSNNGDGTFESIYDLNDASYDNKSFDIDAQEGTPHGLYFKSDGTKVYVVGRTGDDVSQFSLSTAWDISTASYDNVTFSIASQLTTPTGIFFKPDGTSFYVQGQSVADRYVYQYNMTTAWDISTASYASKSFSTSSEDSEPLGVFFKPDGTKAFVTGLANTRVYQYGLSTAWDASTGSYDSVSFDFSATANFVQGLAFSSDGTKLFLAGYVTEYSIFSYALSTAWDLTTVSYVTSFSVNSQEISNRDVQFSTDGTKMYIVGTTNKTIYQYTTGELGYPTASPVTVTGLTNGTSYTFNVWAINPFGWSSPSDASGSVSPAAIRALFGGGASSVSSYSNVIDFVSISTLGNASDFGDLTVGRTNPAALSSATRGVWAGGQDSSGRLKVMDYVTITSAGNASDFGDLLEKVRLLSAMANSTRGVYAVGYNDPSGPNNIYEYITIASTGNSTDFGDSLRNKNNAAGCASPTRGIVGGGQSGSNINEIEYITIASTGNATDFGDLTNARRNLAACSSDVRGVFSGGIISAVTNVMDYITIASTGNASDFGDLTQSKQNVRSAGSNTRGLVAGGSLADGTMVNVIEYFDIATAANASDFGDLTDVFRGHAGCSNGHGGLQ